MKKVLVTGGKGQLASCLKDITAFNKNYDFIYVDIDELDICQLADVQSYFKENNVSYCINCAAYTAVDKAELDRNTAELVNIIGAKNLALVCNVHNTTLIHISTDFVFDGEKTIPYKEQDKGRPLNVYGETKLKGEKEVALILEEHFIFRTSWLYSEYGHNFLKTMLQLGHEKDQLDVVYDQIGTPTYAGDLAKIIMEVITSGNTSYGTFHYSNKGVASWYDFAKAIFEESKIEIRLKPIKTECFPTPAKRPRYSVLDKSKIKNELKMEIPYWRDSMKNCLENLNKIA